MSVAAEVRQFYFSTHVMSEAEKLCDTIGIIHNGRLLTEGSLPELRDRFPLTGPRGEIFRESSGVTR